MAECIWRGTLYAGLVALYVAGLAALAAFITWGFTSPSELNLWYLVLRVVLVGWLVVVIMVCAAKRFN
jgi:hypothetical protein